MVVDTGIVRNYIKPKADSTLYNMRKVDLIEYVRTLEHNYNVAVSFNENQAKYIESLTVQKWIPVTERLPEPGKWVLCACRANIIEVLKYDHTMGDWDSTMPERCYMKGFVTHWMPLPEPPKGE